MKSDAKRAMETRRRISLDERWPPLGLAGSAAAVVVCPGAQRASTVAMRLNSDSLRFPLWDLEYALLATRSSHKSEM
jgi:hypothetical protein